MNIPYHTSSTQPNPETTTSFREPIFECTDRAAALELSVYLPGVDGSGVEVASDGPDLSITARRTRVVRPNFATLHLEAVQSDYRLKLRLGNGYDLPSLRAKLSDGRLTLWLPKRESPPALRAAEQRRVA